MFIVNVFDDNTNNKNLNDLNLKFIFWFLNTTLWSKYNFIQYCIIIFKTFSKMSRRYDSKTTTFTPDGRLQQI